MHILDFLDEFAADYGWGWKSNLAKKLGMTHRQKLDVLFTSDAKRRAPMRLDVMLAFQRVSGGRVSRLEDFVIGEREEAS